MPHISPTPAALDASQVTGAALFAAEPSRRSIFWRWCQSIARIGTSIVFEFKAFGLEHIPPAGGAILASNHQSNLDPILLAVRLKRPVTFMAKSELFTNPAFGWFIRSLHAFPVKRGVSDVGAMRQAIQLLQGGYLLNFFPEGTRTRDGNIGRVQPGIALVVKRAGVPVIPVAIDGAFESMGRGSKMFRPRPIFLQYGPPLELDGLKAETIVTVLGDTLKELLQDLRAKRRALEGG